jgi:hypothetical protein
LSVVVAGVSYAAGSGSDAKQMTIMDKTPPNATLKPRAARHSDVEIDGEAFSDLSLNKTTINPYIYRHAPSQCISLELIWPPKYTAASL